MYFVREADAVADGADAGLAQGPSMSLLLTEPARSLADLVTLPLAAPWLARAPRGDGHGVLVLPGLLASDSSTALLRRFLRLLGYDVRGWRLGRNLGPTGEVLDGLPARLGELASLTGGPVSVIGWSLGGIYARELARQRPGEVRRVITLGSPFALTDARQSHADRAYQRRSRLHATGRVPTREELHGRSPCRRPRSTPGVTASSRGVPASNRRASCIRTWRCDARTSVSAWIRRPCG